MSEKVWRGYIHKDGIAYLEGQPNYAPRPFWVETKPDWSIDCVVLPAADFDAMQARVVEIEDTRNHLMQLVKGCAPQREVPNDLPTLCSRLEAEINALALRVYNAEEGGDYDE